MVEVTPESLREWRLEQGLTQDELAHKLGVDQATIAKWETGAAKPGKGWYSFWQVVMAGLIVGSVQAVWEELQNQKGPRKRRGPRVQRRMPL